MELASLNRWKAALIHLAISAAIALVVVTLMLVVWYPRPYFSAMGGDTLILLLIGVDVVIGPLITLIIFDPGKRGLKFDLAVIAALQLAALVYGCSVMFGSRPVYSVFVVDRFDTVAANQVDEASLAKATGEFSTLPISGPKIIAARQPADPQRQADIIIQAMNGGADLANLPDLYIPYADARGEAAQKAHPVAELMKRQPSDAATIRGFLAESGRTEDSVGFLPMKARNRDMTVIVDKKSGDIVGIIPVYPW